MTMDATAWWIRVPTVFAIAGFQLYWTKSGGQGYVGNFASDHRDCVTAAGRRLLPLSPPPFPLLNWYSCRIRRSWSS